MKEKIKASINASIETQKTLIGNIKEIETVAQQLIGCLKNKGKIICFGNGGSSADAQHFAAELVGRFKKQRKALASIALTTNTSILTAVSNDFGYEQVFSRQIEAVALENDFALGISTSGTSKNVIKALETAKQKDLKTALLTSKAIKNKPNVCDYMISIDSSDTPRIQEAHITILHILCELIDDAFENA
ncbi:MAG: SIS domain-containing protein [Candidatus Gygaella obscura]|nr:SIS domain-containing protein [Candidatus Gygaella obscura]